MQSKYIYITVNDITNMMKTMEIKQDLHKSSIFKNKEKEQWIEFCREKKNSWESRYFMGNKNKNINTWNACMQGLKNTFSCLYGSVHWVEFVQLFKCCNNTVAFYIAI